MLLDQRLRRSRLSGRGRAADEARLALAINEIVASKRLTLTEAAARLGVGQPKISALVCYRLDGFSVERLMTFLTALDRDVEMTIKKKPRSRPTGRVLVNAA